MKPMDGEEAEYNRRVLSHSMEVMSLAPKRVGYYTVDDIPLLQNAFTQYLALCDKNGMKVGTMGTCCALGIEFPTLINWSNGMKGPEFQEFAKAVRQILSMIREDLASDGKIHPVLSIFWQRNYDGLRTDTEQIQNALEQDEDYANGSKQYKEKYRNLIGE